MKSEEDVRNLSTSTEGKVDKWVTYVNLKPMELITMGIDKE